MIRQLQLPHFSIIRVSKIYIHIIEMARRRTFKNRKSLRRKSRRDKRKSGGGWSDLPKGTFNEIAVNPGNQVHFPYTGPGKDCTGNPNSIRPGWIFDYSPKGLPGFSGGRRYRNRKSRGGAAMPPAANDLPGPVTNPNLPPVSGSVTPKPADFPDTTGVGGTVGRPQVVMSMPGVPTPPGAAQMPKMPIAELSKSADPSNLAPPPQKGGRYGFFPEMGPLNPANGVGVSPPPFGRIPCEVGTYNPLNPNPDNIQRLSTAPLTPPFVSGTLAGGGLPAGTSYAASSANFPVVRVGDADSMRYYAPTAGYRNDFMTFQAPSPVPGLTIQTPYDAKAFNQACIKTGGSRKNRKNRGGALPVALNAGKFIPVALDEIWTRKDFDGSNGLLPVKFGGKRKTKRVLKNRRKTRRNRN
jgi:hypothetical protein